MTAVTCKVFMYVLLHAVYVFAYPCIIIEIGMI